MRGKSLAPLGPPTSPAMAFRTAAEATVAGGTAELMRAADACEHQLGVLEGALATLRGMRMATSERGPDLWAPLPNASGERREPVLDDRVAVAGATT